MKKNIILIMLFSVFYLLGCNDNNSVSPKDFNYRQEMRNFVIGISKYAKDKNNDFVIIPQNGQELITENGDPKGILEANYINAVDATGREDLFYGYVDDDFETPKADKNYLLELCTLWEENNLEVLTTDYCSTKSKIDNSYKLNEKYNFISFAADERELNNIPEYPEKPHKENSNGINKISDAKNFLYLINESNFSSKQDLLTAVSQTDYDLIIMDLFHNEIPFLQDEINSLKFKSNGAKRLVVCYKSIGEAEDYRYYWNENWLNNKPDWLDKENPNWEGNYLVKYWNNDWQNIIYGTDESYLDQIIKSNFDGVYLDIIEAYEYYEGN